MIGRLTGAVVAGVVALPVGLLGLVVTGDHDGPPAGSCRTVSGPGTAAGLDREQTYDARVIIADAARAHLPRRAAVVAVTTALTEAGLRNPPDGDRDSVGAFQQRPSQGWGTPAQLHDVDYAATAFYRHLRGVPDWRRMPVWRAAQAVQRSAVPAAYARNVDSAHRIVRTLAKATCTGSVGHGRGRVAVRWALGQLGKPYRWGATGPDAYDCSGLVMRAWQHAGVTLPRTSQAQWRSGPHVSRGHLRPGDLVFFEPGPTGPGHVGLYLSRGRMVEAPHTGAVVRVSGIDRPDYLGAVRPQPPATDSASRRRDKGESP